MEGIKGNRVGRIEVAGSARAALFGSFGVGAVWIDPGSRRTCANFTGSAKRLSAIIRRRVAVPASVKKSRGMLADRSMRIRPRSTRVLAGGGSFGCPFCWPPRQVLNWNPSATEGNVLKNWSSSRRMYSRSAGVRSAPEGLSDVVMSAIIARPAPPSEASHDRPRRCGQPERGAKNLRAPRAAITALRPRLRSELDIICRDPEDDTIAGHCDPAGVIATIRPNRTSLDAVRSASAPFGGAGPLDQDQVVELARREVVHERARLGSTPPITWPRSRRRPDSGRDELFTAPRLRVPRKADQRFYNYYNYNRFNSLTIKYFEKLSSFTKLIFFIIIL